MGTTLSWAAQDSAHPATLSGGYFFCWNKPKAVSLCLLYVTSDVLYKDRFIFYVLVILDKVICIKGNW